MRPHGERSSDGDGSNGDGSNVSDGKIRRRWKELSQIEGKEVAVNFMGAVIKGTALDIDDDGVLLVQEVGGGLKRVVAGDVHVRR